MDGISVGLERTERRRGMQGCPGDRTHPTHWYNQVVISWCGDHGLDDDGRELMERYEVR